MSEKKIFSGEEGSMTESTKTHSSNLHKANKAVFPGKYIQGEGLIQELPDLMKSFGKKGMILSSPTVIKTILSEHTALFEKEDIYLEKFSGECCETEIERCLSIASERKIEVLAGMGGGKVIDTAKIVADKAGIPVIIVPTIASTDAPCSGCAVIYTDDGVFESVYYQKMNPQVVLVDMQVMANAPTRFLVSGMGDALSTWFEARSCAASQSMNECGGHSTMAGLHLAKLCYDILLQYGVAAKLASENKIITAALNHVVEANTLLSGIGFESSGLATAHSVHNGLSALEETHAYFHGEKVAFGVLTGLHLTDALPEEMNTVYRFCEEIGLPTTLADIGLKACSRDKLMLAAIKACAPQEGIHHEAVAINPEKVLFAMIAADAMGRRFSTCAT
ncbi:MAG: glycerol dehydrogenase [Bacteroidales bacterium]|nr:glycerol dehydrogenase [Bacteroidales bacterium]MDP2237889.1 glycerol dehydrogenase [Bacteroidales bacterium]